MTAFRTCTNCVLQYDQCAQRTALKAALAGLSVTSVKFRCSNRKPLFYPGQRVSTTWVVSIDEEWLREANEEAWPATVIKAAGPRFVLKVDDVLSDHGTLASEYFKSKSLYIKASVRRMRLLNEPARKVCVDCGRVGEGEAGRDGCYTYAQHRPRGCIADPFVYDPAKPGEVW